MKNCSGLYCSHIPEQFILWGILVFVRYFRTFCKRALLFYANSVLIISNILLKNSAIFWKNLTMPPEARPPSSITPPR